MWVVRGWIYYMWLTRYFHQFLFFVSRVTWFFWLCSEQTLTRFSTLPHGPNKDQFLQTAKGASLQQTFNLSEP